MQSGTNLLKVRDYNRRLVLEMIRLGDGVSRAEIAERTGLTSQTVSNIVRRLLDEGFIVEAGKRRLRGGRKPRMGLSINPGAGYALGAHVDRDEVRVALLDLSGEVVAGNQHELSRESEPSGVITLISGAVEDVVEDAGVEQERILGLGVACPGPLDPSSGVVHEPPGMPGWRGVRLKEALEAQTGYEVVVDNDAVASAVGERWKGSARGVQNFMFVYKGWGMGAGLFIGGQVYRGKTGTAGEIGHMPLDPNGPECPCRNRGCLIRYCSPQEISTAVRRRLRRGEASILREDFESAPQSIDFGAVRRAALAGDKLALEELERSARVLGNALVGLVNILDLELVVIGGKGFGGIGYIYEHEIREAIEKRSLYPDRRDVRIELSTATEDAGAVGAASLILHAYYAPRMRGLREV